MSKNRGNDLAYPSSGRDPVHGGMTIREQFASMAMQAIITRQGVQINHTVEQRAQVAEGNAIAAVVYADALIEKLKERGIKNEQRTQGE